LAAQLREQSTDLRIIVLGAADDSSAVHACIRAGAIGCIDKNTATTDLIAMIRRAYAGEVLYSPDAMFELLLRPASTIASQPKRTARLGERELEVLTVIATGLSSAEAADQLGVTVHTIRTHVRNIIAKLNARSKLDAVLIAIREGQIKI